MHISQLQVGGFKEAQAHITGQSVFKSMKFESGVHRVQRVPSNDTKIQTSAASVVVLPIAEEKDLDIKKSDLRVDVFRSNGAGGQSVQKTESAVRITHIPTGCVVAIQDERSQHQNRAKAMVYLRARIYDLMRKQSQAAKSEARAAAGGTGDRSDKIRTYNFPQDRVTDHRVGVSLAGVERLMNGESLTTILDALYEADEKDRLEQFLEALEVKRKTEFKVLKK
jgi:peptide chain release factor 1